MNTVVFSTTFKTDDEWYTFVNCLLMRVDGPFPLEVQIDGTETSFVFNDARSLISSVEAISLARGFKKLIPRNNGWASAADVVEEQKREWFLA